MYSMQMVESDIKNTCQPFAKHIAAKQLKDGFSVYFYGALGIKYKVKATGAAFVIRKSYIKDPALLSATYSEKRVGNIDYYFFPDDFTFNYNAFLDAIVPALCRKLYHDSSSEHFGCCHSFLECSRNKGCIHMGDPEYAGCAYSENLEKGKIFYH